MYQCPSSIIFFPFHWRAAAPWMLSEKKITVTSSVRSMPSDGESPSSPLWHLPADLIKATLNSGLGPTVDFDDKEWAGVEDITAIECHIIGIKESITSIYSHIRFSEPYIHAPVQTSNPITRDCCKNIPYVLFVLSQKRQNNNPDQLKSQAKKKKK